MEYQPSLGLGRANDRSARLSAAAVGCGVIAGQPMRASSLAVSCRGGSGTATPASARACAGSMLAVAFGQVGLYTARRGSSGPRLH
jgi:hypothetical protein